MSQGTGQETYPQHYHLFSFSIFQDSV